MIFDPPPKSRRRVAIRLILPLLVAAAVVIAAVVSAAGETRRGELEYLDAISSQADELARSGSSMADVMGRIDVVDRDEFTTVFQGATSDLEVALEFVAEEPPSDSLIPIWALYRQAVQAWDRGVAELSAGILLAADDPQDVTAVNLTGDGLAELRAGDNLYQELLVEFEREEVPEPVGTPAVVRMVPTQEDIFGQSVSYVAAARRSTAGLGLRPGLKVSQVLSDPAWQINVEGQAVVPATETVAFSTVITNSGNVASQTESVRMELAPVGAGDGEGSEGDGLDPVVAVIEVPPLEPAGQVTIEFEPVEVIPDIPYEVLVRLEVANPDSDPTDNELRIPFTVNPE